MSGLRVAARTTSVSRELLSGTALLVRCSNDQAPWRPRSLRNSPPRPCSSGRGHAGQLPPVVSGSGTLAGPGRSPGSTCPAPPGRTRPQAGRAPRQGAPPGRVTPRESPPPSHFVWRRSTSAPSAPPGRNHQSWRPAPCAPWPTAARTRPTPGPGPGRPLPGTPFL